jgi:Leucine-rich repeat (LRR) protein
VVPESIGNLTALTGLWLSDNELTVVPEAIVNLSSLTRLWLSDNPADRGALRSLASSPP